MDPKRCKAVLFGGDGPGGETIRQVYGSRRLESLRERTDLFPVQITPQNIEEYLPQLHDIELIFSTWGMFQPTAQQLDALQNLRAVLYAAGSVKHFALPFLERGVTVVSGWAANAVPVAEFTLAQILLANKGYFRNVGDYLHASEYSSAFRGRGNYGATVSILGAGQIGRKLIELLRPFHLRVLVYDPFLSAESAEALNVQKVETLHEAFARGNVVTNHLADVPETEGLLNGVLFRAMPHDATFINTGRGKTIQQDELLDVLRERADLIALLDVTQPEPLPLDSPLRALPNVHISGHIAGSIGDEVGRMADLILEEFERWQHNAPLRYSISLRMLETMA
jgi:phosphoglycerate dehydrogenase-like enzyme